ncbi:MAG TPA: DUF2807 domain-containing protein [Lacibacter sp.]|nr:DUF2807 domain-containing protein [Lacibacter sp.]
MKQFIIMAVSLLSFSAAGVAAPAHKIVTSVIASGTVYDVIVINNDIDVVLTESSLAEIRVTGDEKNVQLVKHQVKKGMLIIGSKSGSLKGKATVHVSVSSLRKLEINGSSFVTSNGALRSNKLVVVVNGEAKFDLKNYGDILIESDEDIDLNFENGNGIQPQAVVNYDSSNLKNADEAMDSLLLQTIS